MSGARAEAPPVRPEAGRPRGVGLRIGLLLLASCTAALPACVPPQLLTVRSGLDSLRTVVDTLVVRDSLAFTLLQETRHELAGQRDILLSTRATTGTTTQELTEQMGRLEGKLDEAMGRFQQITQRSTPPPPAGPDPNQLYDQAAQDLTQGRYDIALQGFRDFLQRFPTLDLADNALYGVGECFFAQSKFDSAAATYAQVGQQYPEGDKVPAALYKLAVSQEKLGRGPAARTTLEDLVRRFPLSGEAQLARERLGAPRRR